MCCVSSHDVWSWSAVSAEHQKTKKSEQLEWNVKNNISSVGITPVEMIRFA